MNSNANFNDIYGDFFNKKSSILTDDIKQELNLESFDIDSLYIDDKSKEILKKIIIYIENYGKKIEDKRINFNMIICSDNDEITNTIINYINKIAINNNYVSNGNIIKYSLYKLQTPIDLDEVYNEYNSMICLCDLNAIKMLDLNLKEKFFFTLKENLEKNKITILLGNDDEIKEFLSNDNYIKNKYFNYQIKVIDPDVNDVYSEIIDKLSNVSIDDEFKIKLLNYISETFNNRQTDYLTYRNNLCDYISFNKDVPTIEISKSIDDIFKELNELVGLEKVKKSLYDLVDLITLKNKTKDDLKISNLNLHMVFLGNPGTGKTTVARMICNILYDLKYIKQNKLIEVTTKDLVGQYVGQTAPKTMSVIEKAMGGVLFIDEAYALKDTNEGNSYNMEAIATLIKEMEDHRDDLVIIFAGYTNEMNEFLNSNSGIMSRIGYTFEFDDYTNEELKKIFSLMVKKAGFEIEIDTLDELDKIIDEKRLEKNFGNARLIRNIFEKTILKHASNTKNIKQKSILKKITRKDICL